MTFIATYSYLSTRSLRRWSVRFNIRSMQAWLDENKNKLKSVKIRSWFDQNQNIGVAYLPEVRWIWLVRDWSLCLVKYEFDRVMRLTGSNTRTVKVHTKSWLINKFDRQSIIERILHWIETNSNSIESKLHCKNGCFSTKSQKTPTNRNVFEKRQAFAPFDNFIKAMIGDVAQISN